MMNIDQQTRWIFKWMDRMIVRNGDKGSFTTNDGGCDLDPGQFAVYVARGPRWNESLNNEPESNMKDISVLQQYEEMVNETGVLLFVQDETDWYDVTRG